MTVIIFCPIAFSTNRRRLLEPLCRFTELYSNAVGFAGTCWSVG
jgi:hypothetical protein